MKTLYTGSDLYLCIYFSAYEHPATILDKLELETSPRLICHLETNVLLFHPGELTWLSYIIFGSLPDWLHQYICCINTFALKLQLLVVAQAWQCKSMGFVTTWPFLSTNWGLVCQLMFDNKERNKQNCNCEARPSRTWSCDEIYQPKRELLQSHA